MARLIDADRLEATWDQGKTMIDNVDAQPTVDPVKHGRWIYKPYVHTCSVCGSLAYSTASSDLLFDYCPYCGAKMDEVAE